jgi:hypothetical protein
LRPIDARKKDPVKNLEGRIRTFFRALGKGDWKGASRLVSDPIDLFGKRVARARFSKGDDASLARALTRLDGLPEYPFTPAEQKGLFGGVLEADHAVFFATLGMGDERAPVTYGVVIQKSDGALFRLFDPTAFKAWALQWQGTKDGETLPEMP